MEWEALTEEEWEALTEEQWESLMQIERERATMEIEQERADDAMLAEEVPEIEDEVPEIEEPEKQKPKQAAPPPPPVPVEVWSLRSAQAFATNIRGPASFRLRAVAVNHATALDALLGHHVAVDHWVIPVSARLKLTALARLDMLLTLGIEAHIAIIADNLYTVQYLESFREWTWELQTAATEFGGVFSKSEPVKRICQGLRKVVAGALSRVTVARRSGSCRSKAGLADLTALKACLANEMY